MHAIFWLHSLKGTANAPENGWSENHFPFGISDSLFSGAMLVSGSVRFFFQYGNFTDKGSMKSWDFMFAEGRKV